MQLFKDLIYRITTLVINFSGRITRPWNPEFSFKGYNPSLGGDSNQLQFGWSQHGIDPTNFPPGFPGGAPGFPPGINPGLPGGLAGLPGKYSLIIGF